MTLYFAKEHFKTAIPLAITSLLVMYTLKGSITSKLPPTSYIKFIDIWLLYGLIIPFIILHLLFVIEHMPTESNVLFITSGGKEKERKSMNSSGSTIAKKIGRIYLPVFQIFFVVTYAIVAIVKHNSD